MSPDPTPYVVELTVGSWSTTFTGGDGPDPAADAIALDNLVLAWQVDPAKFPAQPDPTTCTLSIYVPVKADGPAPAQGQRVDLIVQPPGFDPDARLEPLAEFHGTLTDVSATPLNDGLQHDLIATDTTASTGEEQVGDTPWDAESRSARLQRILALSELPFVLDPTGSAEGLLLGYQGRDLVDAPARDVDSQPTRDLIASTWPAPFAAGLGPRWWTVGWVDGTFFAPDLGDDIYYLPIVGQHVDPDTGAITLPIVMASNTAPDSPMSLPYQLTHDGDTWQLTRRTIETPDTSMVSWIPADAIDRAVIWRQDKANSVNRVRLSAGTDAVYVDTGFTDSGSVTAAYPDLIEANGPVEQALEVDADQTPGANDAPYNAAYFLLGTHYDATPRPSLDTFTILPERIADGAVWPRLFAFGQHKHVLDTHVGRLVLVTDIPDKWNLHHRADYFGRLVGATLTIAAGRIRMTASLLHRVPASAGDELPGFIAIGLDPSWTGYTHTPVTWDQLTNAGTDSPTWADLPDDITWADLALTEQIGA